MRAARARGHLTDRVLKPKHAEFAHVPREDARMCSPRARMRLLTGEDTVRADHVGGVFHDRLHGVLEPEERRERDLALLLDEEIGGEIERLRSRPRGPRRRNRFPTQARPASVLTPRDLDARPVHRYAVGAVAADVLDLVPDALPSRRIAERRGELVERHALRPPGEHAAQEGHPGDVGVGVAGDIHPLRARLVDDIEIRLYAPLVQRKDALVMGEVERDSRPAGDRETFIHRLRDAPCRSSGGAA